MAKKTTKIVVKDLPELEMPSYAFDSMDTDALIAVIRDLVGKTHYATMFLRTVKRERLLPAFDALKRETHQPGRQIPIPGKPNFTEACHIIGITPELVAVWRHRTETDDTIWEMVGGQRRLRKGAGKAASSKLPPAVVKLIRALLDGKEDEAEMLAQAIAEEYEI